MKIRHKFKAWIKKYPKLSGVIIFIIAITALDTWVGLYPFYYATGPISGTVVDKKTGQPIEGAVVILQFTLEGGVGNFHNTRLQAIHLDESVTDARGRYYFSAWRAKHVFRMNALSHNPTVFAYRRGYKSNGVSNDGRNNKRDFEFANNGARIELEAYESPEDEIYAITKLGDHWGAGIGLKCAYERKPNLIIERNIRIKELIPYLPDNKTTIRSNDGNLAKRIRRMAERSDWQENGCKDPREVFSSFLRETDNDIK